MSVTLNAKGTSTTSFIVGKDGTTITQGGVIAPPAATDLTVNLDEDQYLTVDAGVAGPALITASAGQDLHINPATGGGQYLVLNANRWPTADGTTGQVLITNGSGVLTFSSVGSGTVTSVAATGNNGITVSGSPVTSTGTLTLGLGNITPTTVDTDSLLVSAPTGNTLATVFGINHGDVQINAGIGYNATLQLAGDGNTPWTNSFELQQASYGVLLNQRDSQPLMFLTSGVEAGRFTSTGYFGINTDSPASRLDTRIGSGDATVVPTNTTLNDNTATVARFSAKTDAGSISAGVGVGISLSGVPNSGETFLVSTHPTTDKTTGDFAIWTTNSGTASEKMRVDSLGQVGIGVTPTTGAILEVNGGIQLRSTNKLSFTNTINQTYIHASSSNVLSFGTNSTERMTIGATGDIGATGSINAGGNINAGSGAMLGYVQGFNDSGTKTIANIAGQSGIGGRMVLVRGADTSGTAFCAIYNLAISVPGGDSTVVAASLISRAGTASPTLTWGNSGNNITLTIGASGANLTYVSVIG